ncbi:MAG: HU family DNA-binding protein [bacterium]
MNKSELVTKIAERTELTKKDTEKVLKAFEEVVKEELTAKREVRMVGFGTFDVIERAAHMGRNPQTKEPMQIAASTAPRFKAGKSLKDAVNGRDK